LRLALSSLAFAPGDDASVAALLERLRVDALEIAFGKYFPDPGDAPDAAAARLRDAYAARGVEIVAAQSLLFGSPLNIFDSQDARAALLARLAHVARLCAAAGATKLVFGSWRNRAPGASTPARAEEIACAFFRRLGDIAADRGLIVCLEPVPARYGATFLTTTAETAALVRMIDHSAIRMHLDAGAMMVNGEKPTATLADCAPLVAHVHLSEPDLVPFGDAGIDPAPLAATLMRTLPDRVASVEMLPVDGPARLAVIETSLRKAIDAFRRA
jgi:sugar phosphate isomerase/epimerase